ncbi:hypothetical protein PRABACTJOHN_01132 [Parabacteroides johnsonii DSM 18315]|uniref:Uncharacterized protein n=1 Tax=Parabacteroides johnsonii DSM 18315 TaxID=537006 RepID=B7B7Y2_9BACT|nr:hypothetical protein PARMER_00356 [Parabacteroides merdae ATCC 43184]EEC97456.1 hypothetical protein PRABACTJOHN_01132 [Parabacteroides johnsonii DSM 18315]
MFLKAPCSYIKRTVRGLFYVKIKEMFAYLKYFLFFCLCKYK